MLTYTTGFLLDYFAAEISDNPKYFTYTLEAHAKKIIQIIEHIGCSTCHFVGDSFGGTLAIQVAFKRRDIVKSFLITKGNLITGVGLVAEILFQTNK